MAKQSPIFKQKETSSESSFLQASHNDKPLFKGSTGRFTNTNTDKSPSYSSRNLGFSEKSKVHKQAFELLSDSSSKAVTGLTSVLSALDNKDDKITFIKACYDVERSGSNPVMHPRPKVMDYLKNSMLDLGIRSGITSVTEEEPIVDNKKPPIRFAL